MILYPTTDRGFQLGVELAVALPAIEVLYKLHARDRAQLVTLAYETGLIHPRQPVSDPEVALAGAHW